MRATIKVTRAPRLDIPRFTRNEMRDITESVKDAEVGRIKEAKLPDGSPARPLAVVERNGRRSGYAIQKQRKTGRNRRDWTFTGAMLNGLKVTVSDPSTGIIKFSSDQVRKAAIRQASDEMFDLSADGEKAGSKTAAQYLDKAIVRANRAAS